MFKPTVMQHMNWININESILPEPIIWPKTMNFRWLFLERCNRRRLLEGTTLKKNFYFLHSDPHCCNNCSLNLSFLLQDLESPPSSVTAVMKNGWLTNGFKETALHTAIWSVLKAKRRMLKNGHGFKAQVRFTRVLTLAFPMKNYVRRENWWILIQECQVSMFHVAQILLLKFYHSIFAAHPATRSLI